MLLKIYEESANRNKWQRDNAELQIIPFLILKVDNMIKIN